MDSLVHVGLGEISCADCPVSDIPTPWYTNSPIYQLPDVLIHASDQLYWLEYVIQYTAPGSGTPQDNLNEWKNFARRKIYMSIVKKVNSC